MTDGLSKRFGWWWCDPDKAVRVRAAFPDKSEEAIRKYVWPELERAAFNYELASRHNGRRKYLLGKRFDRLSQSQMIELMRLWPRERRPLQPIRFLSHAESPNVTRTLRQITSERSLGVSANAARDVPVLRQRALKRAQQMGMIEREYAQSKGWTVPQYFTANLAECGDTTICKAVQKHLAAERRRLNIPAPRRNKGRANKSAQGISFGKIEAMDVWTRLPRKEAETTSYDDAQKRSALREAKSLFVQWTDFEENK